MFEDPAFLIFLSIIAVSVLAGSLLTSYWLINNAILLRIKARNIASLVSKFNTVDTFWNLDEMTLTGTNIHHEVMYAWSSGNFKALKYLVTPRVKMEWISIWQTMKKHKYRFVLQAISVNKIEVIGIQDHYDNDKDSFQIAVSGSTRRYFYDYKHKTLVPGHNNHIHHFVDILSFKRYGDQWLLDHLTMDANFFDILKIRKQDYHHFVDTKELN